MKAWQQGALAGAAAGVVSGSVVGALVGNGMAVGSLAEWAGAVGTVLALIYAGRALRHDVQSRAEDEERSTAEDAAKVEFIPQANRFGMGDPISETHIEATPHVHNGSSQPMHDVHITVMLGDRQLQDWDIGTLATHGTINRAYRLEAPVGEIDDEPLACVLRWRDRTGRRWRIGRDRTLHREP